MSVYGIPVSCSLCYLVFFIFVPIDSNDGIYINDSDSNDNSKYYLSLNPYLATEFQIAFLLNCEIENTVCHVVLTKATNIIEKSFLFMRFRDIYYSRYRLMLSARALIFIARNSRIKTLL